MSIQYRGNNIDTATFPYWFGLKNNKKLIDTRLLADTPTDRHTHPPTYRLTYRQKHTHTHTDRQTHTHIQTHTKRLILW
jgi:hypothetical protein